jgi:electron transfer flavoprotein beta subunit
MNVAVFVKQIPDPERPSALDPNTFRLVRGEGLIIDDADRYGVEVALMLRDSSGNGEVSAFSMAPAGEIAGLRAALAMGVDRAVLISDPVLVGADALSTAKILAAAVAQRACDLVVAATESTDGYTGTVPVQVAELLGWPSISYATSVAWDGASIAASRQTDLGAEEVACDLPVVVSVTAGIVEPRYPSMRGIMSARTKPLEMLSVADLGLDSGILESSGAREQIVAATKAAVREPGVLVTDEGEGHARIVEFLAELKLV